MNSVLEMHDYHVWANGIILNRLKELPQDIYHREIQSGFSSVSKVLSHIYLTDLAWFGIISGKSMRCNGTRRSIKKTDGNKKY